MVERTALLALNFYKKAAFTGSDGNKRYRVEKIEIATDTEGETEVKLQATIWPGPFAFAKTEDEKKRRQTASFSEDGLQELVDWINATEV